MSDELQPAATGLFETATDQEAIAKAVAAATPVAPERADLAMVNTLDAALRDPMYALLASLADNKYVLGRRYAEWCTGAPMLESAVAVTVVPAAIGLPFKSCTVNWIDAEAPAASDSDDGLGLICAADVDMMSRWDTPIASVVELHDVPEQVIPLNVPEGPSHFPVL